MVKINILCVGKIKESFLIDGIKEYEKRLSKYAKITIKEVDDEKIPLKSNETIEEQVKIKESNKLISLINKDECNILLDVYGNKWSSEMLALKIGSTIDAGKTITFIIAGSLGPSEELRKLIPTKLSLSDMTFTHQMTRLILLEQIYRGFKINNNETYHK